MARERVYEDSDFLNNIKESDTAESFSKRTGICPMTVKRRFGTWNKLREMVGFTVRPQGRPDKYTIEQLVGMVITGDTSVTYCKRTGVNRGTIYNRAGSWTKLKGMAGA